MTDKYCELCDLHLDKLSFESHIKGKKHAFKMRMHKKNDTKKNQVEVIVTNLPRHCPGEFILKFFQQFGAIANFRFLNRTTIVLKYHFEEPSRYLTQNNIFFGDRLLNISINKRTKEDHPQNKKQKLEPETKHEAKDEPFLSSLNVNKTFDEQVIDLLKHFQDPISIQKKKYDCVIQDLSEALNSHFQCKLHKFGSSITELGLKNSDIDIYVELLPAGTSDYQKAMEYLKCTRRILLKSAPFRKVIGVFGAKTPIIKCEHVYTGLNCDINFKNSLGIHNSNLIKFLQTLDIRIKPLFLVIKCWAKNLDLTGSNKITAYALTMMVIYYLQQKNILPPIKFLQSRAFDHGEWNCIFDKEKGRSFPIQNNQNLLELLRDFFKFYDEFNFENVISPLTGVTYSRNDFSKTGVIPSGYELYKAKLEQGFGNSLRLTSSIIVIDPFELSHNITPSTNDNILQLFKQSCSLSAKCFENNKTCDILKTLFSIQLSVKTKKKIVRDYEYNFLASDDLYFQAHTSVMDPKSILEFKKEWFHKIKDIICKTMHEILMLNIQDITVSPDRKTLRTETTDQVHSPNITENVKYHCTSTTSVLRGRQKFKILKADMTNFEHEKAVTKIILEKSTISPNREGKYLSDFNMTITSVLEPTKITLKLINNTNAHPEFKLIVDYLKKNLRKLIIMDVKNESNKLPQHNSSTIQNNQIKKNNQVKELMINQNEPSCSYLDIFKSI